MTSTATPGRLEPPMTPVPPQPVTATPVTATPEPPVTATARAEPGPADRQAELKAAVEGLDRPGLDQVSRIEEKTARIEEKFARSEALMLRVEDKVQAAVGRVGEAARQSDLAALRNEVGDLASRTRRLPGFGTLLVFAILTSLLSAGLTAYALVNGVPGVIPPIAGQAR